MIYDRLNEYNYQGACFSSIVNTAISVLQEELMNISGW